MVSSLLQLLTGLKTKLALFAGALVVFLGVVFKAYLSGRKDGSAKLKEKIEERNQEIQNEWNEIDRTPVDFDGALDGLRKRSAKAGNQPKA